MTAQKRTCGAKRKSDGKPCESSPMANGRCYHHGGPSLKGKNSPSWKHGRYSKYIPGNLQGRYAAAISDPELLSHDDEIALLQSRLSSLLEKIATAPDSGTTWSELRVLMSKFDRSQRQAQRLEEGEAQDKQLANASQSLEDLRMMIRRGVAEWAAWGEVIEITDHLRRLKDSEQKRRVDGQHIIFIEDVMALFDYTVNLINEIVTDQKQKSRLSEGLYRYSRRMDGAEAYLGDKS